MCVFGSGRVGGVGAECVTGLGLGFTNSGGTWGLCFGCGDVGGVGREWVGGLGGWGSVMSPLSFLTSINNLQVMQNAALRTTT